MTKTYLMTVTVIQSGKDPYDAKATLEQNLGPVFPDTRDFEVSPVMAEVALVGGRIQFKNSEMRDGG